MARRSAYGATLVEVRRERMTGIESRWLVSFTRPGSDVVETAKTLDPVIGHPREVETNVVPGSTVDVVLNGRSQVVGVSLHRSDP